MIYRYDGSFAGLLCLLAEIVNAGSRVDRIDRPPYPSPGLFDQPIEVMTDPVKARRYHDVIVARLGARTLKHIRLAYLSEQPGIERHLHKHLELGWKVGRSLNSYLAHTDVHAVLSWSRRTAREAHRMKGFVRFRELRDGSFYAPLRTDTNVLPLLAPHFAARMDRPWLLHDVVRGWGVMGDARHYVLGELREEATPVYSDDEERWQRLWRTFHSSVAIESRLNKALQQQFMPLKYREFLVECEQTEGSAMPRPHFEAGNRLVTAPDKGLRQLRFTLPLPPGQRR